MTTGAEVTEALRAALAKLGQEPRRRYTFRLSRTAEAHLRRLSWPHKWRGRRRSMRHLRPVRAWLLTLEDQMNTREAYAEIDGEIAGWIAQGRPPWTCESDVPPELREVRFVQRVSNL